MKKKKTIIFSVFTLVIAVFLSICFGVIIPSIKLNKTSSMEPSTIVNKNYESNLGNEDSNSNGNNEESSTDDNLSVQPDAGSGSDQSTTIMKNELEFFVYDRAVKKTKEICGDTTTFEITFKIFVTNNTTIAKTILASAFSASYAIGDYATYYTFTCNNEKTAISLAGNETQDFDFTLKYVVTDTENFIVDGKYDLAVSYMLKEVISLNI